MQIVSDVYRKGGLDGPVEEEEQPGEGDQAEEVISAQEAEAGLGGAGIDRLLHRCSIRVRSPGLGAEEGERGGIETQQPRRRDSGEEDSSHSWSDDRREPDLGAGE